MTTSTKNLPVEADQSRDSGVALKRVGAVHLPHVDRALCAAPELRRTGIEPCGRPAVVVAPEGSGYTFAYCLTHADRVLGGLEHAVSENVDGGDLHAAREVQMRAHALRQAIEAIRR